MNFIKGDATEPIGDGPKIIAHICNDVGRWGKGFVMAISKRWPQPRSSYMNWFWNHPDTFKLGAVQMIEVESDISIANMIAQHNIYKSAGLPPIRYASLAQCLATVSERAMEKKATVHMPRIGCGLAGGEWEKIEKIIEGTLIHFGIETFIYDL